MYHVSVTGVSIYSATNAKLCFKANVTTDKGNGRNEM